MSGSAARPPSPALTIVAYSLGAAVRRRIFPIVLALTVAFLVLYGLAAHFALSSADGFAGSDPDILDPVAFAGATIFGLAMFATLFLGAVLAIFLTLGIVRDDAASGLLQPIVVRPIGRATMLGARFFGAAGVSAAYVAVVFMVALATTTAVGDWSPDHTLGPCLALMLAVTILAALSTLCSVFMSGTAQGIAVFMLFGAGLTGGLIGQIGDALNSETLEIIADISGWALPFDALYEAGLAGLISDTEGLAGVLLSLGPFGGSEAGSPLLVAWSIGYAALALALAFAAFARRDL